MQFFSENLRVRGSLNGLEIAKIEAVTVLFADIDSFYEVSRHTPPDDLLRHLHAFFVCFDDVAERYRMEKIKTIGDAYMCAGGLKCSFHPALAVLAALAAQACCHRHRSELWSFRIGIHTGDVYAGRLGRIRPAFDIWGTTVNLASRMESSAVKDSIQISDKVWAQVQTWFYCEPLGELPANLGTGCSYSVKGIREGWDEEKILAAINKDS